MRVIINADDFGMSTRVNSDIIRLIESKKISSTTIIANSEHIGYLNNNFVKNYPNVSWGLHFCLDELCPLTRNQVFERNGITDSKGHFVKYGIFRIKHPTTELLSAIKDELEAQLNVLLSRGIVPSHVDSHHHIHKIAFVNAIIIDICRRYGISRIRGIYSPTIFELLRSKKLRRADSADIIAAKPTVDILSQLSKYVDYAVGVIRAHNLKNTMRLYVSMTDSFYPYQFFCECVNVQKMVSCDVELMCHPGHAAYLYEADMVENDYLRKLLNYELITYNDL